MPKQYVSNNDETIRLFENDFLESLSRVHWSIPLVIYMPISAYLFYYSVISFQISFYEIILNIVGGLFVWTFTEYFLHRFIFHYELKSELGKRLHFLMHGVHHDYPKDSKRLVMPPSVSIPLALLFYYIFYQVFSEKYLYIFFASFLWGYLFYDTVHYAIHHYNMKNKFWLSIKNHHMKHHYQNSFKGFGVSQPTWDVIFKTDFPDKK